MATPEDEDFDRRLQRLSIGNEKYQSVKKLLIPKPEDPDECHIFLLLSKNKEGEEYPLYVARIQKGRKEKTMNYLRGQTRYPQLTEELELDADNPIEILTIIGRWENVERKGTNDIKLTGDYTLEQFKRDIINRFS